MCTATIGALTFMQGIVAPIVCPRPKAGATLEPFPGRGAPTRWNEITGFSARHHY